MVWWIAGLGFWMRKPWDMCTAMSIPSSPRSNESKNVPPLAWREDEDRNDDDIDGDQDCLYEQRL